MFRSQWIVLFKPNTHLQYTLTTQKSALLCSQSAAVGKIIYLIFSACYYHYSSGVTVCGWPGEGCCCAPAALSRLLADFCSARLLWLRLSPSGSQSPSVLGFWLAQDVGMLLEVSKGDQNSFSVLGFSVGTKKKTTIILCDIKMQYL